MEPIVLAAVPFAASLFSLATVLGLKAKLGAAPRGEDLGGETGVGAKMNALSDTIQEGAMYVAAPGVILVSPPPPHPPASAFSARRVQRTDFELVVQPAH